MKIKKILLWIILMVIIAISNLAIAENKENDEKLPFRYGECPYSPKRRMTPKEAEYYYFNYFTPVVGYIHDNYPILDLKKKFQETVLNIGAGRKIEILIGHDTTSSWATAKKDSNGKPLIVMWMPLLISYMKFIDEKYSDEKARQLFEDKIVTIILHEYFHLTKQDYWKKGDSLTRKELAKSEEECWAYTCEKVIQPMLEAGRGPIKNDFAYGINFLFNKYGRDRKNPKWIKFFEKRYGEKQL